MVNLPVQNIQNSSSTVTDHICCGISQETITKYVMKGGIYHDS